MAILVATGASKPHSIRNAKRTPSRTPMPPGAKSTSKPMVPPMAKIKPTIHKYVSIIVSR